MQVTIIGGGPAGLAAAGALKQKGVESTILEQGDKVGTSWRGHYERLHLHTLHRLSGLPGELIHSAQYINADPYKHKTVLVVGSGNSGAEIAVDLVEGDAKEVLVSIRTPPNIQRREFLGIATQQVGILAEKLPVKLADQISLALQKLAIGDLRPYGLDPPKTGALSRIYEDAQIPLIDVGFLDALKQRRLTVVPAVEGFTAEHVKLAGGTQLQPDAVIAATGYSRGLEPLIGHLGILRKDGTPEPSGGETSPSAPGLYFIGYRNAPGGLLRRIRIEAEAMAGAVSEAGETAA